MAVLTIPPEVAAEGAKKLFALAATANRDAMTLVKQAMALARNEMPSRPLGVLKKYVREYGQYGSDEVSEVIASIEAVADPKHVKILARKQAENDAMRAEFEQRRQDTVARRWEPGGDGWNDAIKTMHTDAETLFRVAETVRQGKGCKNLFNAVRGYCESGERIKSLWRLDRYTPTNRVAYQDGNVIAGPWDTAG